MLEKEHSACYGVTSDFFFPFFSHFRICLEILDVECLYKPLPFSHLMLIQTGARALSRTHAITRTGGLGSCEHASAV